MRIAIVLAAAMLGAAGCEALNVAEAEEEFAPPWPGDERANATTATLAVACAVAWLGVHQAHGRTHLFHRRLGLGTPARDERRPADDPCGRRKVGHIYQRQRWYRTESPQGTYSA